jgi:type VII secretion protein EccE
MSTSPEPATVRFGRRSTRGLLLGFSTSRVLVIAAAAAIAIAGLVAGEARGFVVSAIVWAPLLATAFVRVAGRPAVEWAPTAVQFWGRRHTSQTDYRATITRPRPAGTLALGGDGAALRFHIDHASGAAMIHDPHRRTLTAVLSVSHPAFVLLDRDDRAQRVSRWGRVLAGLAQSGTLAAIQITEATVPDPGDGLVDWYASHGNSGAGWAAQQYAALLDQARLGSSTHRTTVSLALNLKAAGRAVKAAGGGVAGAATVLGQDMTALADALRQCGLTVGGWLSEEELAANIRSAYEPSVTIDPRADPGARLGLAGPVAISEHWDCLRHDSAWSTVLWISEWPRIDVPPDFLHPVIFAPGVRRTLSVIARPRPSEEALRQIRKEKTEAVADQAQKARVGQLADLADAHEYEDLLNRERSVIAGHTDVEFTGLITVTAPSRDLLDAGRVAILRAAAQAACDVRPVYGHQAQGFIMAALPLARTAF